MLEDHAEFKDACQDLETRIDEISDDLRNLPTDYKMIGQYSDIDKEIIEVPDVTSSFHIILIKMLNSILFHSPYCGNVHRSSVILV